MRDKIIRVITFLGFDLGELGKFFKIDKKGLYYEYWDGVWKKWRKDYAFKLNDWKIVDSYDGPEPF